MEKLIYAVIAGLLGYGLYKSNSKPNSNLPAPTPNNNPSSPTPSFTGRIINVIGNLKKHPTKTYGKRLPGLITGIIIHHSGTSGGSAEAYARYHVDTNKWPGIGYHFVVAKDGTIKQTNSLDTISYHASGQNTQNIGICCIGHYDHEIMSEEQLNAVAWLVNNIRNRLGNLELRYHNQYSSKTCPGLVFPYGKFEERVRQLA